MHRIISHHGVLGMKWGVRNDRSSSTKSYGGRVLTKQQHRDETAARQVAISSSTNPHAQRKEADLILNRAARESNTNINKALNRFASENDLKNAIKRSYLKPPTKKVEEMSTNEIEHHLNNPRVKAQLQQDHEKAVKRGKIVAGVVLGAYAAISVASFVSQVSESTRAVKAMQAVSNS